MQMLLKVNETEGNFIYLSFLDILVSETIRPKSCSLEDEAISKVILYSSLANTLHALNREESADLLFDAVKEHLTYLHTYTRDTIENLTEFLSHVISETHVIFPW